MTFRFGFLFRSTLSLFAAVLSLAAAWLLVIEFIRPSLPYFPRQKATEDDISRAEMAASVGWLRGDLWSAAAIASSSANIASSGANIYGRTDEKYREETDVEDRARALARRAVSWSPHDSRAWLLLAAIDSRLGSPSEEVVRRLRMSYFTGPNETALTPLRVRLAIHSNAFTEPDLNALVAKDIRSMLLRNPADRETLVSAYVDASAEGKQFIEATAHATDKDFLDEVRARGTRR